MFMNSSQKLKKTNKVVYDRLVRIEQQCPTRRGSTKIDETIEELEMLSHQFCK